MKLEEFFASVEDPNQGVYDGANHCIKFLRQWSGLKLDKCSAVRDW